MSLSTDSFDYYLPPELIAQKPADRRDGSRMMVLDPATGDTEIHPFPDIVHFLQAGDLLVCNNTKVLRGRMFGRKNGEANGAKFELLLVAKLGDSPRHWSALLKPGKRAKAGTFVALSIDDQINDRNDSFTVLGRHDDDTFEIEFNTDEIDRLQVTYGHIPLPPYIKREDTAEDATRYQTIFAHNSGAVAAPTAGLHFTPEVMRQLQANGVDKKELTLHVGPGTFKTVSVANVEAHKMHFEEYFCPEDTATAINTTRQNGHRVLAVGTTTVRTLESCVDASGLVHAGHGSTDIFLYPPHRILGCDLLLTNFHLPKSTLLMLVACLVDREKMLAAYERAKAAKMRFYSYGDCMLILPRR